jgi:hypothetical protein
VVHHLGPYAELQEVTNRLLNEFTRHPGLINVDSDLKLNKPEIAVAIDRERAADWRRRSKRDRPHAGNHARRPAGDPLQAATASSTT